MPRSRMSTRSTPWSCATCTRRSTRRRAAASPPRSPGSAACTSGGALSPRSAPARCSSPSPACSTVGRAPATGPTGTCSRPPTRGSGSGRRDPGPLERGDGVITAGGVTVWQDLALHLIARFCGPEHAARTAKVYLLAGHEDGQLPFSAMTRRARTGRCRDPAMPRLDRRQLRDPEPGHRDGRAVGPDQQDVRPSLPGGDRPPTDRLRPCPADRGVLACDSRRDRPRSTTSASRWATRTRPSSAGSSSERPA